MATMDQIAEELINVESSIDMNTKSNEQIREQLKELDQSLMDINRSILKVAAIKDDLHGINKSLAIIAVKLTKQDQEDTDLPW